MTDSQLLLNSTYVMILESKDIEAALDTAQRVLNAALNEREVPAYARAETISEAWFQLALLNDIAGKKVEAAEAAKNAFEYDSWLFEQYVTIVRLLLAAELPEYDAVADKASYYLTSTVWEYHDKLVDCETIKDMILEVADRHPALKFRTLEIELAHQWAELVSQDESVESLLEVVDQWEKDGVVDYECKIARANIYYELENYEKVVETLETLDFSSIPFYGPPRRYYSALLELNRELPEQLVFPKEDNVFAIDVHIKECVTSFLPYFKSYEGAELEEDEEIREFKGKGYARIIKELCHRGFDIFERFKAGEKIGTATAPAAFSRLCYPYGLILEYEKDLEAAVECYERGMKESPFPGLSLKFSSTALAAKKPELALRSISWLRSVHGEMLDLDDSLMNDRMQMLALGQSGDLEGFIRNLEFFEDSYRELYRNGRIYAKDGMVDTIELTEGLVDSFVLSLRDIHQGAVELREKYPDNIDLVSVLLMTRLFLRGDDVEEWAQQFHKYVPEIREKATDKAGKKRLLETLFPLGYITANYAIDDETNEITNRELFNQGVSYMEEATSIDGDPLVTGMLYYFLGRIYFYDDETEKAMQVIEKALDIMEPSPRLPHEVLGNIELFSKVSVKDNPDAFVASTYYFKSYLASCLGDANGCIAALKESYAINPDSPSVWNSLARELYDFRENPEDRELLDTVVNRFINYVEDPDPEDYIDLLTMAAILKFEDGLVEDGALILSELREIAPSHWQMPTLEAMFEDLTS